MMIPLKISVIPACPEHAGTSHEKDRQPGIKKLFVLQSTRGPWVDASVKSARAKPAFFAAFLPFHLQKTSKKCVSPG